VLTSRFSLILPTVALSLAAAGAVAFGLAPAAASGPATASASTTPATTGRIVYSALPFVTGANKGGHFYRHAPSYYGSARLHVIGSDGSGDQAITPAGLNAFYPDTSPDGRRLAFVTHNGDGAKNNGLWVSDATGADATLIWSSDRVGQPAWSPDGKRILESTRRLGVVSIRADGTGQPRPILPGHARRLFSDPTFTPDGREILFSRYTTTKSGENRSVTLWAMGSRGSKPHQLVGKTASVLFPEQPDVSPDGAQVAFAATDPALPTLWWISTAKIDGSGVQRAARSFPAGYFLNHPSWSPGGTKIVATLTHPGAKGSGRRGSSDLVIVTPGAHAGKQLALPNVIKGSGSGLLLDPDWQPVPAS